MRQEEEKLVLDNMGLAKYHAKEFKENGLIMYEDLISIATLGLIKAARTYDEEKGANFATYSSTCIVNEIIMALRRERKYDNKVSLQEPRLVNDDGRELLLEEVIQDPSSDFIQKIEEREVLEGIVEFALNEMSGKKRLVVLYYMAEKKQEWIAEQLEWDQSYISRIWRQFMKDYKRKIEKSKTKDYLIRFSLKKVQSEKGSLIPEFTIESKGNRIWITAFSGIECLDNIAGIIQEINEFNFWI